MKIRDLVKRLVADGWYRQGSEAAIASSSTRRGLVW
jgi:hypothetical protein